MRLNRRRYLSPTCMLLTSDTMCRISCMEIPGLSELVRRSYTVSTPGSQPNIVAHHRNDRATPDQCLVNGFKCLLLYWILSRTAQLRLLTAKISRPKPPSTFLYWLPTCATLWPFNPFYPSFIHKYPQYIPMCFPLHHVSAMRCTRLVRERLGQDKE